MSARTAAYPDVLPLAARIARLHGCHTVLSLGRHDWAQTAADAPELNLLQVGPTGSERPDYAHQVVAWTANTAGLPVEREVLARSVVTWDMGSPHGGEVTGLQRLLELAPVAIVVAPEADQDDAGLDRSFAGLGLTATFVGWTSTAAGDRGRIAIVDQVVNRSIGQAPAGFSVVAVMTAFNEEDVIGPSIEALISNGVGVHVIDNWSTDGTYAIAEKMMGRGVVGLERFPEQPAAHYEWAALLGRVEEVAARLRSDWVIHHDADERRAGPWPDRSLRDALWTVDQAGFNAVDHTVLNFRPIDNAYVDGSDFEAHFRHFELGRSPDLLRQVKAWRNVGRRVVLADGGHDVVFAGRRVFPYKFLLKHYPIRSQAHGERKVHAERRSRWNAAERALGWHAQYDGVAEGQSFLFDPQELTLFDDDTTRAIQMVPLISGVGLAPAATPGWAKRGLAGWLVYRSARAAANGFVATAVRRSRLYRSAAIRGPARRLKRALAGTGSARRGDQD